MLPTNQTMQNSGSLVFSWFQKFARPNRTEQNRDAPAHDQGIGEKDRDYWGQDPLHRSKENTYAGGHVTRGDSKQARYLLIARPLVSNAMPVTIATKPRAIIRV